MESKPIYGPFFTNLFAVLFVLLIFYKGCSFLGNCNQAYKETKSNNIASQSSYTANQETILDYTAYDLISVFNINRDRGDEIFKGRTIKVTGLFYGLCEDKYNQLFVRLDDDPNDDDGRFLGKYIRCYVNDTNPLSFSNISKGEKVELQGTCGSLTNNYISMYGCVIIAK